MILPPPAATVLTTQTPDPEESAPEQGPPAPAAVSDEKGPAPSPAPPSLSLARDLTLDEAMGRLDPSLRQCLETDFRAHFTGVFEIPAPREPEKVSSPATGEPIEDPDADNDD